MEYRDFINTNMNDVITALNGSITPAPVNSELYRDFLNRKADDVITALNGSITPAPAGDELYRDFIERKFDDVIAGIGGYVPPISFPSASGAVCSFDSQYAGLPLKSHIVDIDYTGSAISGVNIGATGKNLFDSANEETGWYIYGPNMIGNPATIQAGSTSYACHKDMPIKGGVNYVLSFRMTTANTLRPAYALFDKNMVALSYNYNSAQVSEWAIIISPTQDGFISVCTADKAKWSECNIQLEFGNLRTNFEPFGHSYNIIFETPIYGGSYDCLTGIVTSNKDSGGGDISPTYQQTATVNLETNLGENNIFADTGDTTLQYIKLG